ncbi:MAG: polyphosphate kinase 1, partial [Nodosilinea sp.]
MAVPSQDQRAPNFTDPAYYISRELSWLEFNRRVLWEGLDPRTPLLEALKFLAIFSKNLDEYFMVRVAAIKQQIEAQVTPLSADGLSPTQQMAMIGKRLRPMVKQQHQAFFERLRPQMAQQGIRLLTYGELTPDQRNFMAAYFEEQIFPVLTPLTVHADHPFPYISNLSLNLVVIVADRQAPIPQMARVKIPKVLPRFITLPENFCRHPYPPCDWLGVPLEEVIAHHLETLFPGLEVRDHYLFRLTRNADLVVAEEEADDLMLAIEQELRKRPLGGSAVRLELQRHTPKAVRAMLMEVLGLAKEDIYGIDGWLGLGDLITLTGLPGSALKDPPWSPTTPPALANLPHPSGVEADSLGLEAENFFALVRRQDQLFHHPYHSFVATVQRFITQAAHDPQVLAIKMTLYRIAGGSPILRALITAAKSGKQVTVLVELKARFDEENNINWARQLEQAGVHVVYGLIGLKTHAKMVMVVRLEGDYITRYCHLGTGDYNPKTARIYTDLGLLSACPDLGSDMAELFNYLTGYSRQQNYRQILVAPLTLRQGLENLIQGEIDRAQRGERGQIIA